MAMRAPVSAEAAGARLPAVIFHAERPAGDGAPNGAAKVDEHEGGPQHHDESHSNHGQDDEGSHAPDGSASGPGVLRLVGLVALEGLWPVKARAGEMANANLPITAAQPVRGWWVWWVWWLWRVYGRSKRAPVKWQAPRPITAARQGRSWWVWWLWRVCGQSKRVPVNSRACNR